MGIWTAQLDFQPIARVRDAVQELDSLGYESLWVGENVGREPLSQAAILLAATEKLVIATGVANIWARDPLAMAAAQQTLTEAYPRRFILGLGVSHARLVNDIRGLHYRKPVDTLRNYLLAMDIVVSRYRAVKAENTTRILAALGPQMLALANELSCGVHSYLVPPEHTAGARQVLGLEKLLIVEQAVVLEKDRRTAREIARRHLHRYLGLPNYATNLRRLGFAEADLAGDGSDRLIDSLVAWGDETAIADRIAEHHQAGATQVCIQVLTPDFHALPMEQWRRLAAINAGMQN
ncbi:LLM class F420-dependent oxidoreductase [Actinoplanes sp. NPDC026619]|uniref:LLM class F420-dependent oxidoreductase n=1 Tax=Actinoplanes sp. NPDC026619 TaxID=3155798 RepID=UPI0033F1DEB3